MASEIERKFLLRDDSWRRAAHASVHYRQGYLAGGAHCSVRIRISDDAAHLNIKSATLDIVRSEYEYEVAYADGVELLALCEGLLIEKRRYFAEYDGLTWEIDVFEGENQGLVVAEVELDRADAEFALPPWAGEEVSHDARYYNVYLARHPYTQW
ncbi:MAG: CYTH domain-containing protein [Chromatiales bacterium]|nr:CYTH domain-containing protein [Chromatiales bacterium]